MHFCTRNLPLTVTDAMHSFCCKHCDAYQECLGSTFSADDIDCDGGESCKDSTWTSGDSKTFCAGKSSCENAIINAGASFGCAGEDSCRGATVLGGLEVMTCSGKNSCRGMKLFENSVGFSSLSCRAELACAESSIMMKNDLECRGSHSCKGAYIEFVTNSNLICEAFGSCQDAVITAVNDVECIGGYSCQSTSLSLSGDMNLIGAQAGYLTLLSSFSCFHFETCFFSEIC